MLAILFTDIEGSTRLWEEHRAAMGPAVARHDHILSVGIVQESGRILKTTGDGFIATFESPSQALAAALGIQEALAAEPWRETGPIRVRMGIHAGEPEARDGDLFGPAMNRTARIMAAGHGGQVLLSAAAAALVEDDLPPGAALVDLGSHRLKDLARPERLYQLAAPNLSHEFPALRTLDAHANNLPSAGTPFLGRSDELAALRAIVEEPGTRLVTITGPGGTGKTRLGLQLAADLSDSFRDGVFFVDLSAERTPNAAYEAVVRALEVPATRSGDALETLKARLRDKQVLLVLDNLEQVMAATSGIAELIQAVPELSVIVTSREALRIGAERIFPVAPLALPLTHGSRDTIAASEAVQLFAERARAVRPDFALSDENAETVAQICIALDGLPLAIELAAARLNLLTPADLLARLRQRLDFLGASRRDLPDRQRTLRGAIDWSYDLLDEGERRVFEMISVFSSASLPALEAVAAAALDEPFALDLIASLVDKSLVQSQEDRATQRFSMLRMMNEYASERLAASPERERAVRDAHAHYYSSVVLELHERLRGGDHQSALRDLETELGNLRTGWQHWIDQGDIEQLLRLSDALWALHDAKGWYHAAIRLSREMLDALAASGRASEFAAEELDVRTSLARALMAIGGYNAEVEYEFERAQELAGASGITAREVPMLRSLASYHVQRTSWATAEHIGTELLALGERNHDTQTRAEGHYVIAASTLLRKPPSAIAHLDDAISLFGPARREPDRLRLGPDSGILARVASALMLWQQGTLGQSVARMDEALELSRTIEHPYSLAYALYHHGYLAINRYRFAECMADARELAEVSERNGYPLWATLAKLLEGVAVAGLGKPDEGLVMTEAAVDLYQGLTPPPTFWPFVLMLRAAVHAMAGKPQEAAALLEETSSIIGAIDLDLPPLRVMQGDIARVLPEPDFERAEAHYLEAITVGASIGFQLGVLTGWTGLVTLRRQLGRTPDGADELAAVYATFTEGLDEHDLVTARAVLDEGSRG